MPARDAEQRPEAKPTAMRDRDEIQMPDFNLMPDLEQHAVAPVGPAGDVAPLPGKRAKRKVRPTAIDPEVSATASQHLGSLHGAGMEDEISDDEALRRSGIDDVGDTDDVGATPIVPNTENLPAVIRHDVALTGEHIEPEWHQVKHLPGYFQSAIRALGRSVFRQFTETPIEDIQVLTTLGNINSEHEVTGMMDWIRRNGARDDATKIDFDQIMPGYSADASFWRTKDYEFLLVHDFAGYYIYGWSGGRGVHLAAPPTQRRLR